MPVRRLSHLTSLSTSSNPGPIPHKDSALLRKVSRKRLGASTARAAAHQAAVLATATTLRTQVTALQQALSTTHLSTSAKAAVQKVATEARAGSIPVADLRDAIALVNHALPNGKNEQKTDAKDTG